jgi:hypothetical protein
LAKTSSSSTAVEKLLTTTIPDRLWHYTSFVGLKGIVESHSIFATDIRFLNDSEELAHAKLLLKEIAADEKEKLAASAPFSKIPAHIPDDLTAHIQGLLETGPFHSSMLQIFVASFSESRDLLSQWRGYATGSSGVSLGSDLRELRPQRPLVVFAPCIYDNDEKRKLLKEIVNGLFEVLIQSVSLAYSAAEQHNSMTFDKWYESDPDITEMLKQIDRRKMLATYDLLRVAALMKHSSFSEEREWRLVIPLLRTFNDHDAQISWGTGSSTLIPRTSQDLASNVSLIKEIILGPGSHPSASEAVKGFMASVNLSPRITRSVAPYRSTTS